MASSYNFYQPMMCQIDNWLLFRPLLTLNNTSDTDIVFKHLNDQSIKCLNNFKTDVFRQKIPCRHLKMVRHVINVRI